MIGNAPGSVAPGTDRILPEPEDGSFWMPPQVSTVAQSVDWLFYFILAISVFFFVLIVVLMVVFVLKYRHREGQRR